MSLNLFKFAKAKRRIKEAGVVKFYYDRKILAEDVGSIGDFIRTAKHDVTYVGCWLSSSLKQDLINTVLRKAKEGVTFTFCLHEPRTQTIKEYASFFCLDETSINTQIEDSILSLNNAKKALPKDVSDNIRIYWHSEMITASFWLIDNDTLYQRIQLDFKIVKATSRWFSFGIEAIPSSSDFYKNIKEGYLSVIDQKKIVDYSYIEHIDGRRKKKEELKKTIHDNYPFDPTKPYVFISYSHKNDMIVLNDVLNIKKSVNCWIDWEMLDGGRNRTENDWTDKIRPILEDEKCLGVISYVSQEGFDSKGYIKECDWIKNSRPEFYCFLIDFPTSIKPAEMLSKIKRFNVEGETETEKQIRDEALIYITQATSTGKESYYHIREGSHHLELTDFKNWLKKITEKNT